MRDYLYLWHQPSLRRIIFSGLEFRDVLPEIASSDALILLRNEYGDAEYHRASGFDFVARDDFTALAADDIYSYGDFCWVDLRNGNSLAELTDASIADLTFFAHTKRPLRTIEIPGMNNEYLWTSHDDGWYTRLYYTRQASITSMLSRLLQSFVDADAAQSHVKQLMESESAWWCQAGSIEPCEATENIDALLGERLP